MLKRLARFTYLGYTRTTGIREGVKSLAGTVKFGRLRVSNLAASTVNFHPPYSIDTHLIPWGIYDLNQDALKPGNVLTSMLKNVDMAAYLFIKSVVEGTYQGGGRLYLDTQTLLSLGLLQSTAFSPLFPCPFYLTLTD
jgi:hypothetical protein